MKSMPILETVVTVAIIGLIVGVTGTDAAHGVGVIACAALYRACVADSIARENKP